jgi:8-oxo-dGTP pyrophosphatase MutT (NUDIX family)
MTADPADRRGDRIDPAPPAIPAATVVLVRDGQCGVESLMLQRSQRISFPGLWVFPGGRIDAADADAGEAARAAAAREVKEETGITVDQDRLTLYARWRPPPTLAKRFDTTFFVVAAPGEEVVVDGAESAAHAWARPIDVLYRHRSGAFDLAPPTWVTLRRLAAFASAAEVIADARQTAVETFSTRLAADAEHHPVALWHGDVAYEGAPLDTAGGRHRLYMAPGSWRYERY